MHVHIFILAYLEEKIKGRIEKSAKKEIFVRSCEIASGLSKFRNRALIMLELKTQQIKDLLVNYGKNDRMSD